MMQCLKMDLNHEKVAMGETTNIEAFDYDNCIVTKHSESELSVSSDYDYETTVIETEQDKNHNSSNYLDELCLTVAKSNLDPENFFNFIIRLLSRMELFLVESNNKELSEFKWLQQQISTMKTAFLTNENLFFKKNEAYRKTTKARKIKQSKENAREKSEKTSSGKSLKISNENLESQEVQNNLNECTELDSFKQLTSKVENTLNPELRRSERINNRKDKDFILCDKLSYTSLKLLPYTSTSTIPTLTYYEIKNKKKFKKTKKNKMVKKSLNKTFSKLRKGKTEESKKKITTCLSQTVSNDNKKVWQIKRGKRAKSFSEISSTNEPDKNLPSTSHTEEATNDVDVGQEDFHSNIPKKVQNMENEGSSFLKNFKPPTKKSNKRRTRSMYVGQAKRAKKDGNETKSFDSGLPSGSCDLSSSTSSQSGKRKLYDPDKWLHSLSLVT